MSNFPSGAGQTMLENPDKLLLNTPGCLIVHAGTNDCRNKSELLTDMISRNLDLVVISETKLDESFPIGQSKIYGYT